MPQNNYNSIKEILEKMESNNIHESRKSLQKSHQKIRNDLDLPDPSYYLGLIKKKKKEIEELNKEIEMYEKMKNYKLKEDSGKIAPKFVNLDEARKANYADADQFVNAMKKLIAAHESGDKESAKKLLNKARIARLGLAAKYSRKSLVIVKIKDLLDKYDELLKYYDPMYEEFMNLDESNKDIDPAELDDVVKKIFKARARGDHKLVMKLICLITKWLG